MTTKGRTTMATRRRAKTKTKPTAKTRKPQDATMRNERARKRQIALLATAHDDLEVEHLALVKRVERLEASAGIPPAPPIVRLGPGVVMVE
jgi:hypothetical protein